MVRCEILVAPTVSRQFYNWEQYSCTPSDQVVRFSSPSDACQSASWGHLRGLFIVPPLEHVVPMPEGNLNMFVAV